MEGLSRRIDRRLAILKNLLHDPGTLLGTIIVAMTIILALIAPWLPLQDPTDVDLTQRLRSPSPANRL